MNLARPIFHRKTRLLLSGLLVVALTGCGDGSGAPVFERAANALGITDPPAPAALSVDVLCDFSEGAPCTPKNLSETISEILPVLASRPGSEVRLWVQGEDVSSTEIVSTITVPRYKSRRRHTLELEEKAWVSQARPSLLRPLKPVWSARQPRRSPIAEALTKTALTEVPQDHERVIVALTDGREVTRLGNFESGSLPSRDTFLSRLGGEALLLPGSCKGIRVLFAFLGPSPNRGPSRPMSLGRTQGIEELWRAALLRAGAREVRFFALRPVIEEDEEPMKGGARS
jgi:hypothetical protein